MSDHFKNWNYKFQCPPIAMSGLTKAFVETLYKAGPALPADCPTKELLRLVNDGYLQPEENGFYSLTQKGRILWEEKCLREYYRENPQYKRCDDMIRKETGNE